MKKKPIHGCYGNSAMKYLNARDKAMYSAYLLPEEYRSDLNRADWAKHGERILRAVKEAENSK